MYRPSKKKKVIPPGDGSQGQVKESIPITPDLMDTSPGSSHKLLVEHIHVETPSSADTGFQQPHQRQHEDSEHQRESKIQISAQG
jgi:hypothetical protein